MAHEPTKEQLSARLNPQTVTIKVPKAGLFRDVGGGNTLYKREGDKITQIELVDLLVPSAERASVGNFGVQTDLAIQRLKDRFGLDFNALPKVNIGDLRTSRASAVPGQKIAPRLLSVQGNFTGANQLNDINQFLGVTQAQIQEAQLNTEKNQLAEGVDTTTPDFAQFGEFTRQLQFGSRGEDVKRLQQFLNAQGFQVAPEGQAGGAGNETDFFGPKTQAALQKFQKTQGIVSSGDPQSTGFGRLGPQTLESVNTFTTPQQDTTEGVGATTGDTGGGTATDSTQVLPKTDNPEIDRAFEDLMNNPNLTDDQKKVAETMFDLISRNDKEQAERFAAAFEAGTEFSNPFFNAQVNMVLAGLRSGLASDAGDLEFEERQLSDSLNKITQDLAASKGQLSFEAEQEIKNLQKQLGLDLETNAQNLAAVGKT